MIPFLISLFTTLTFAGEPTGVGGGGDVVDNLLEGSRAVLIESVREISQTISPDGLCECRNSDSRDPQCLLLKKLSVPRRRLCQSFLQAAARQMLKLNTQDPVTPFTLIIKDLFFPDPSGFPRPIVAQTKLGPGGDIQFDYRKVSRLYPDAVVELLGHEFGHKVEYGGFGKFVDDNSPVGAFDFAGGGRKLLDTVGGAIVTFAADRGYLGRFTGTEDLFECRIKSKQKAQTFTSKGLSPRLFRDGERHVYTSGVGNLPRDFACGISEVDGVSNLTYQVRIFESTNCEGSADGRNTKLEIWRTFVDRKPAELLVEKQLAGVNPLCGNSHESVLPLKFDNVEFEVRHLGRRNY